MRNDRDDSPGSATPEDQSSMDNLLQAVRRKREQATKKEQKPKEGKE